MSRRSRPRLGSVINFADPNKLSGRTWYRIENAVDDENSTDLYIHDEIGGWGVYSTDLIRELMTITTDTIKVRINSPGGDVFEGLAIHNALRTHPATIKTYVDGLAASAASFIFQAGEQREMGEYTQLMIHNPSALVWGESEEMRKMADLLDKLRDTVANLYADRSGQDVEQFVEMMGAETWFNASEAVDFGLADSVDVTAPEKPKNQWNLGEVYMYAGRENAPAPRRTRAKVTNTATRVPSAPAKPISSAPVSETRTDGESALSLPTNFADLFAGALKFAAEPPVPTNEAPFEWDPNIFTAILRDKTATAPAVATAPREPDPVTFDQAYDAEVLRRSIIERM